MRNIYLLLAIALGLAPFSTSADDGARAKFDQAVELVHAFSGAGTQLQQAMQIAESLSASYPQSGFAQTIWAEALSSWQLGQNGEPEQLRNQIIELCNEALRLDPRLALAHVAKGRAQLRASQYEEAEQSIGAALGLDPRLTGAMFLRAEIFRRTGKLADGDDWYRKFIEAVPSAFRQSNAYYWLGTMYSDAAWDNLADEGALNAKARAAYERMVELDPGGAWKNVNFAVFLNSSVADFVAAEKYSRNALAQMEFPMARFHLAAAKYQQLWTRTANMDDAGIKNEVEQIQAETRVDLESALQFPSFGKHIRRRLQDLMIKFKSAEHRLRTKPDSGTTKP
jgi:tetratricopeptide (TPR) repeat protein